MRIPLSYGSQGPDVRELQELLNKAIPKPRKLCVDGLFGPDTATLLRQYQTRAGLRTDGIAGPKTWHALATNNAPFHSVPVARAVKFRDAPWMAIALEEVGKSEIPGSEHNPRILQYHATTTLKASNDETPWCSAFVNWCLQEAGIKGTGSATASSWYRWGAPSGAFPGAITIIQNNFAAKTNLTASGYHVGFLVQDTRFHHRILGGNQSDQVKITLYPKSSWRLIAYRWPK